MIFYDFEVFKYDWLVVMIDLFNRSETVIINDAAALEKFYTQHKQNIFVGFNSRNYDQYILKGILCGLDPKEINDFIIVKGRKGWEFSNVLRKIRIVNYDVMPSPPISLKTLEGFMGSNIRETSVPFDIDRKLTDKEITETVKYCTHDVEQTIEVFMRKKEEFDAMLTLCKQFKLPLTSIGNTEAQITAKILDCTLKNRHDEFDFIIEDFIKIKKYREIYNWFKQQKTKEEIADTKSFYGKKLEYEVAGVLHKFGWGGVHGALKKFVFKSGQGYQCWHIDVTSYYPSYLIAHGRISRSANHPERYSWAYFYQIDLKHQGKKKERLPFKKMLNALSGAMKHVYNPAYDPCMNNSMVVNCQLAALMLIERLEVIPGFRLVQSNTDGLVVIIPDTDEAFEQMDNICYEWECQCSTEKARIELEFDEIEWLYQKDVNNYTFKIAHDDKIESIGGWLKTPNELDNDLPILKIALQKYFYDGTRPEDTICNCDELIQFQKIVKISGKYAHALYNPKVHEEKVRDENGKSKKVNVFEGGHIQSDKTFRVFADKRESMGGLFKVKGDGSNPQKFADTPEHANIWNQEVKGVKVPVWLDREWYITMAKKRLRDFGVKV